MASDHHLVLFRSLLRFSLVRPWDLCHFVSHGIAWHHSGSPRAIFPLPVASDLVLLDPGRDARNSWRAILPGVPKCALPAKVGRFRVRGGCMGFHWRSLSSFHQAVVTPASWSRSGGLDFQLSTVNFLSSMLPPCLESRASWKPRRNCMRPQSAP